jgi:hypothetical protein
MEKTLQDKIVRPEGWIFKLHRNPVLQHIQVTYKSSYMAIEEPTRGRASDEKATSEWRVIGRGRSAHLKHLR